MKDMLDKYNKAIVTGGAGFIGSHIIGELLDTGMEVISIDNYITGKRINLSEFADNKNFREIKCDILNLNKLRKYFEEVDIVFHEAASKKTICLKDPRKDLKINAEGTFNILELCRKYNVKKLVHASTGSVYGEGIVFPQTEDHPLVPTSYYGVSKLAGERYVKVFNLLYGMDTTILRYFHVYGPKQDSSDYGGVIPIFIRRVLDNKTPIIFGDGSQERSFTYVDDVVDANIFVANNLNTKGEVYNCASGVNVTIKQLADKVLNLLNKEHLGVKYEDWALGDIKKFDVDNLKLRKLGFNFKTNFEKGLIKTINWYKNKNL